MMITYTMIALWGVICIGLLYRFCRSAIVHEMSRRHDKKLRAENIYIIRGKLRSVILTSAAVLVFPVAIFLAHLLGGMGFHLFFDIAAFCAMCIAMYFFCEAVEGYSEISPEGIERGESFTDTVFYPLNAIDAVSYDNNTDREYADSLHFYTKSGKLVAEFCPVFGSYPLLAMTRFRIENDRWPDIGNPEDTAQINAWANRRSTLRYFRYGKISGLAEVDM